MMRWAFALCLLSGCSRASTEGEAKQWAAPPPGKDIAIPASLDIAVTVNGTPHGEITRDMLRGIKPDFADDDHRAWLITELIPEARVPGSTIEAVSSAGINVKFMRSSGHGFEPALFLTRRGDVIVAAVDPKDPFPRYHGQGGRLRRAGDPMPHVSAVARVEISRGTP